MLTLKSHVPARRPRLGTLRAVPKPAVAPYRPRNAAEKRPCVAVAASRVLEPFVGCNCYYLLDQAVSGNLQYVEDTLRKISEVGFTVVRTWAFHPHMGAAPADWSTNTPGKVDFTHFDEMMEKVKKVRESQMQAGATGAKVMLCLTNCPPNYGGLWQYVRWANNNSDRTEPKFDDSERYGFYTSTPAKAYYRAYISQVINHCREKGYDDLIHSWDICNEPRNKPQVSGNTAAIAEWVGETASWLRGHANPNHLITVGSEGFFNPVPGRANADHFTSSNPYGGGEGANWLLEADTDIDMVCIHPYWDQWCKEWQNDPKKGGKAGAPEAWLSGNISWIEKHIEAKNKPLVLQEFNMPDSYPSLTDQKPADEERIDAATVRDLRRQYFDYVTKKLDSGALTGAMVWMVGLYPYGNDRYTIYLNSDKHKEEVDQLRAMCQVVKKVVPA